MEGKRDEDVPPSALDLRPRHRASGMRTDIERRGDVGLGHAKMFAGNPVFSMSGTLQFTVKNP